MVASVLTPILLCFRLPSVVAHQGGHLFSPWSVVSKKCEGLSLRKHVLTRESEQLQTFVMFMVQSFIRLCSFFSNGPKSPRVYEQNSNSAQTSSSSAPGSLTLSISTSFEGKLWRLCKCCQKWQHICRNTEISAHFVYVFIPLIFLFLTSPSSNAPSKN